MLHDTHSKVRSSGSRPKLGSTWRRRIGLPQLGQRIVSSCVIANLYEAADDSQMNATEGKPTNWNLGPDSARADQLRATQEHRLIEIS